MTGNKGLMGSAAYQFVMLVLCFFTLGSLVAQLAIKLDPEVLAILDYADYAVCVLFLVDFLLSFWRAPNRMGYLATWGWLDLLSSIPTLSIARWGRMARIVRIIRVLRALRATKLLTSFVTKQRAQNTFLSVSLAALLLIIFCSVAILQFEDSPEANIKNAEDAIWWAFTTITTVGYGDRFPTSPEGRFIAVILMGAGVGLFGTFSGLVAAWFLAPKENALDEGIAELRKEIHELREELKGRRTPQDP